MTDFTPEQYDQHHQHPRFEPGACLICASRTKTYDENLAMARNLDVEDCAALGSLEGTT